MKLISLLFFMLSIQLYSNDISAQNGNINIPPSTLSVHEILTIIESQSQYLFVYNKNNINVNRLMSISAQNESALRVLDKVFRGTNTVYIVEGHNIVLTTRKETNTNNNEIITVRGIVSDKEGNPIIGANIVEKGIKSGTTSDVNGKYSLNTTSSATLIFTYIGYQTVIVPVNGKKTLNIRLEEKAQSLEAVVVTAMGIIKEEASLSYSTQTINNDEFTRTKDINLINSLAGKVAGVSVTKNSSGLGGSAKVSIRGIRSANENGNNQPLYVIDGVPIINSITEQAFSVMGGDNDAGNRDSGDGISNLNPDDIESINVLKGATAAALYGSQAANGVILITTKKSEIGMQRITFTTNTTINKATCLPKFQNTYGMNGTTSWGNKELNMEHLNNIDKFFNQGICTINSIVVQAGKEKSQSYFSYSNTTAKGIIQENELQKNNLTLRQSTDLFMSRLSINSNVSFISQTVYNRPTSGGYYMNPLVGLYTFPRGKDITEYRDNYEYFDKSRNMPLQNWYTSTLDFEQNPYWIINRILSKENRYRVMASLNSDFRVNSWIKIQARGNIDLINDKYQQQYYAGTAKNLCHDNGRYVDSSNQEMMIYGDVMILLNKKWKNYSLNAAAGGSYNMHKTNLLKLDSGKAGLYYANVFSIANMILNNQTAYINETRDAKRNIQSIFGMIQLGWKNLIYADITARNEWSSTLANTSSKNTGFFYPSIGFSWIANQAIKLPEWINFYKFRLSWAQVGNDLPIGITSPSPTITAGGMIKQVQYDFDNLRPEISTSWELGMECKLLSSRINIDLTIYRTNTKNQLLYIKTPTGKYPYKYFNAGKIQNQGVELSLGITPLITNSWSWKTDLNYSTNKNKVISLGDNSAFDYGTGVNMPYRMRVKEGGALGDIYGNDFSRDSAGKILVTPTGLPKVNTGNYSFIGNANPNYLLGLSNTLAYKGIHIYALIDGAIGGHVISLTQSALDLRGVSKKSGEARDRGYVEVEGQKYTDVEGFYSIVANRSDGCTSYYRYNRTNIRLRELSIGYSIPQSLLVKGNIFKNIEISLIAQNLFFLYKDAPFDPDGVLSVANNNQGVDIFGMPAIRNVGFNIKLTL